MKLYNMRKQGWREGNFERGEEWRSEEIYQCTICDTRTNKWIMGGWPGMGPRIFCPAGFYKEHGELEQTIDEYKEIDKERLKYSTLLYESESEDNKELSEKAKQIIDPLSTKIELLYFKIEKLRKKFKNKKDSSKGRFDDIIGVDDNAIILNLLCSSKYLVIKEKSIDDLTEE